MTMPVSGDTYRHFLRDLGSLLKESAQEAVKTRNQRYAGTEEYAFDSGRVIAFNEVISTIQQQASAFGIALSDLQLDDVEPDQQLV